MLPKFKLPKLIQGARYIKMFNKSHARAYGMRPKVVARIDALWPEVVLESIWCIQKKNVIVTRDSHDAYYRRAMSKYHLKRYYVKL